MLFDYRVGGVQKGQNIDYVIYGWSLMGYHPWSRLTLGFFLNVHEQTLFYSVLGPYLYVVVALYSLHFEGKWI